MLAWNFEASSIGRVSAGIQMIWLRKSVIRHPQHRGSLAPPPTSRRSFRLRPRAPGSDQQEGRKFFTRTSKGSDVSGCLAHQRDENATGFEDVRIRRSTSIAKVLMKRACFVSLILAAVISGHVQAAPVPTARDLREALEAGATPATGSRSTSRPTTATSSTSSSGATDSPESFATSSCRSTRGSRLTARAEVVLGAARDDRRPEARDVARRAAVVFVPARATRHLEDVLDAHALVG